MTEPHSREDLHTYNDRSLKILARAIALSEGQFSLILVRCNYASLQKSMVQQLRQSIVREKSQQPHRTQTPHCDIRELVLPEFARSLYAAEMVVQPPSALMIFGLESVTALDRVLAEANQMREEFRKNYPFPLVLWINDAVMLKLIRLAPDFKSWAATSIKFEIATDALIDILRRSSSELFTRILDASQPSILQTVSCLGATPNHWHRSPSKSSANPQSSIPNPQNLSTYFGSRRRLELEFAQQDLHSRAVSLERSLAADVQFVLGCDAYANNQLDIALNHYQRCLDFWKQELENINSNSNFHLFALKFGAVLFHIGLCYCCKADRQWAHGRQYWEKAKNYLQQCINEFEKAQRLDLVAKFIIQLGEVLALLQAWDDLQEVAQKALILHHTEGEPAQVARDYGFLAEVNVERAIDALKQFQIVDAQWLASDAKWAAQQALDILTEAPENQFGHRGLYLLLLARSIRVGLEATSQRSLDTKQVAAGVQEAIAHLELARLVSHHRHNPTLSIRILEELRSLYFQRGQYLEAFKIKQEQRALEHQYGFRAFIGAAQLQPEPENRESSATVALEISASCRIQDVDRLLARLGRNDYKLTIIHGNSGVGKSSLVTAGLVPALQQRAIGDRVALPVVLRVYSYWIADLGRSLGAALTAQDSDRPPLPADALDSPEAIAHSLRQNADRNLLTVLIFDQFEEFFFVYTDSKDRRQFFEFLRDCLNIPFVKIILSLREDYLHYLLEWERLTDLDAINNNILDKDIRYYIGDFSKKDACSVIQHLTERSQFYLEPSLIDALVKDLAGSRERVSPIELQVVGAQLQEDKITTEQQYRRLGDNPKATLVERSLQPTIEDCGHENEEAAWTVLFSLTAVKDEKARRPLKTKDELAAALRSQSDKLNLILEILFGSGLVVRHWQERAERYQLVHDYLVHFIRQKYESRETLNLKEQLTRSEQQKQLFQKISVAGFACALLGVFAGGLWLRAEILKKKAEILRDKAEISEINARVKAHVASSEMLFISNQQLDALLESLRAWKELQPLAQIQSDNRIRAIGALQQAVYGVWERNRLEGHRDSVWSVVFSPDGKWIASAGNDETIKIWTRSGKLVKTLIGHSDSVTSLSFSPNGEFIASASRDKTVKIWRRDGKLVATLIGHSDRVYDVSFSPDGKLIASASHDRTVKLWSTEGKLLQTFYGHAAAVESVSFSPDGELLASASDDKTVKIWQRDGTLVTTLKGHNHWVMGVTFSPDGQTIASASRDTTVKLWKLDGTLLATLKGHNSVAYSVSFSPDGQQIATGSDDQSVKLWKLDGTLLRTLKGHSGRVTRVSFSPDGKTLASASIDKTVKLWSLEESKPAILEGHSDRVNSISISSDGQLIATGSRDKTVKIWRRDGTLLQTIRAHSDRITNVSFSPDGQLIASSSLDKTVKLWNLEGKLVKILSVESEPVYDVSFSADGKLIATASRDKTAKVWSLDGQLLRTFIGHSDRVNSVRFSPNGQTLVSASDDATLKIWSLDGRLLRTLAGSQGHLSYVTSLSLSPDGQQIASGSWDNTVKLWGVEGTSPKTFLKGYSDSVTSVSFSPDGETIASGSWDGMVKLWSKDGTLLKAFQGDRSGVLDISFSPDGKMLAAAYAGNAAILWNLNSDDLVGRACNWLNDYLQTNPNVTQSDRNLCKK